MNHRVCQRTHKIRRYLDNLPYSQKANGRHRCAHCAYELGYDKGYLDAFNKIIDILEDIKHEKTAKVIGA